MRGAYQVDIPVRWKVYNGVNANRRYAMTLLSLGLTRALGDPHYSGHMDGWGWGMTVAGMLLMVAIVALIVWLVWSTTRTSKPTQSDTPRQILDRRYAEGDIDRDQYLQRREDLE
jgi:putative membrane protein